MANNWPSASVRRRPLPGVAARYNAAPTQQLPVIINAEPTSIQLLTWGLVPAWARDKTGGTPLINARLETAAQRPSFRDAWRQRRCLVLADGFYEWQRTARGKVPMRIALKSNEPFAFAGLWEEWHGSGDDARLHHLLPYLARQVISPAPSSTPNDLMAPIHRRMPVILRPEQEAAWLDTESVSALAARPGTVPGRPDDRLPGIVAGELTPLRRSFPDRAAGRYRPATATGAVAGRPPPDSALTVTVDSGQVVP